MGIKDRAVAEAKDIAVNDLVGADEWKRSKVGWLTGATTVAAAGKAVVGIATGGVRRVRSLGRAVFHTDQVDQPLPTTSDDPAERFRVAQKLYRRTEADIVQFQASTHRGFLLYAFLLVCAVAFGIFSFGAYDLGLPGPVGVMARFIPVPALLALTMRWAFYNWQFRTRRLGRLQEWLRSPADWWPMPPSDAGDRGGPSGKRGAATTAMLAMAVAVGSALVLFSGTAHATTSVVDQVFRLPGNEDIWRGLLEQVFPGLGPLNGTQSVKHGAIAESFSAFLAVLLGVASMMMSWHILIGMVNTAHEGKVLGQRWHQIWAPMRVTTGVGMLAPVVKGYCMAQILVIQIAVWGGSLGNVVWNGYITGLSSASIDKPGLPGTLEFFRQLSYLEACHAAFTVEAEGVPGDRTTRVRPQVPSWPTTPQKGPQTRYSNVDLSDLSAQAKGDSTASRVAIRPHIWNYGICGTVTANLVTDGDANLVTYDTGRIAAIDKAREGVRDAMTKVVRAHTPGQAAQDESQAFKDVETAKAAFDRSLLTLSDAYMAAVNKTAERDAKFKEEAKKAGWASAGAFYMTLSRVHAEVTDAVRKSVLVSPMDGGTEKITDSVMLDRLFHPETGIITAVQKGFKDLEESVSNVHLSRAAMHGGDGKSAFDSLMSKLFMNDEADDGWDWREKLIRQMQTTPGAGSGIQNLIDFGHRILWMCYGILGLIVAANFVSKGGTVAKLAAKVAGMAWGPAKIIDMAADFGESLMMMLMMLGLMLLSVGVIHAYILPMIPYMQFFFFTIGLLILVVEGVIAAPLWAFMHVRMDGQEFIDQNQRAGYMIIFNLFLRVPLALFGLFFSLLVFDASIWLLSKTFYPAVIAATTANTFGIIGVVTYLIMLGYLHYQVAIRSFHLITQVPDRVSRWFGAQADGGDGHEEAKATNAFVAGQTVGALQQIGQRAFGAGMYGKLGKRGTDPNASSAVGGDPAGAITDAGAESGVSKATSQAAGQAMVSGVAQANGGSVDQGTSDAPSGNRAGRYASSAAKGIAAKGVAKSAGTTAGAAADSALPGSGVVVKPIVEKGVEQGINKVGNNDGNNI